MQQVKFCKSNWINDAPATANIEQVKDGHILVGFPELAHVDASQWEIAPHPDPEMAELGCIRAISHDRENWIIQGVTWSDGCEQEWTRFSSTGVERESTEGPAVALGQLLWNIC